MSTTVLLVAMAVGNPRACGSCYTPSYPVKTVYRDRIVKEPVYIDRPIIVRDPVSYLATIIPSNTYNYTINTPPAPQVQQATLSASFNQAQQGYVQQQQQGAYAVPQQQPRTVEDRLDRLERMFLEACEEMRAARNAPQRATATAVRHPAGKCAVCHDVSVADADGGGFVMFDAGKIAPLSERDLRKIVTKVSLGEMPPKGNKKGVEPLTPQEAERILQWANKQE